MGLVTLIALVYLAHLSAATKCPQHRPLTARQSCNTNQDCSNGKTCCDYSDSKFCVYTDPNTCISEGKVVNKGESITLKDNCSTCDCQGFGDLICTNDACVWPKQPQVDNFEAAHDCPPDKPFSAQQQCRSNRDCEAGKSCCFYSGSNFCVSTDPNTCVKNGRIIRKDQTITLKDGCSTCTCRGYDFMPCTNDGCYWPKQLPTFADPNTCVKNGKTYRKGITITSKDFCSSCTCRGNNDMPCRNYACHRSNQLPTFPDPNTCVKNGKTYRKGITITSKDFCSSCTCRGNNDMPCRNYACHRSNQLPTFPDPNTCVKNGKTYRKGITITSKDFCSSCTCRGNNDMPCRNYACHRSNRLPTFPDPNTCVKNGKTYRKGITITSKDFCSSCTCRGNNDMPCRNYACHRSNQLPTFPDPNTCVKNGKTYRKGITITSKDFCSSCTCRGNNDMPCRNYACHRSNQLPTFLGCNIGGRYFNHGSSFTASDGCNTCYCSNGKALCTLKGCYGYGFNRFFR